MRVAILGATSMLAADFVAHSLAQGSPYEFGLFARTPDSIRASMAARDVAVVPPCAPLGSFADGSWDTIVNFVGVGDPARAVEMGASILAITREWDDRVLAYLDAYPNCRYVFLSSGAAFAEGIREPIDGNTRACFPINALPPTAFYGIAKFYAEAVHRARPALSIIDIRVFNYLSAQADLEHRFLVTEAITAIRDGRVLGVDAQDMWRDYLGAEDFAALLDACLAAPAGYNGPVDAYSLSPISKQQMLKLLRDQFELVFEIAEGGIDATGRKSNYFSHNRAAEALGYKPNRSSAETIQLVSRQILSRQPAGD